MERSVSQGRIKETDTEGIVDLYRNNQSRERIMQGIVSFGLMKKKFAELN